MELGHQNKRVVVTGSSKGIGYAIARSFALEGAKVILNGRDAARLQVSLQRLRDETGCQAEAVACDLSSAQGVQTLVQASGEVDILVNNAGAIPGGGLDKVDDATWRRAWDLKVFGFVDMIRHILPKMQTRGSGVIVNVIGIAGRAPRADYICGSMGNAALIAMTQALGGASTAHGVRVFGVNPSPTQTDRLESLLRAQARQAFGDEERWMELTQRLAFGRMADPAEVADLVVFAASQRCGYLSGTVIDVDAGMVNRDTKASH